MIILRASRCLAALSVLAASQAVAAQNPWPARDRFANL